MREEILMLHALHIAVNGLSANTFAAVRFLLVKCSKPAVLATFLLLHGAAQAEDNFRMTMTGCQADSASIQNDTCRSGGHGVFAKRAGATCRLICPMPKTNPADQWDGLQLFGKDPDGAGAEY